MAPWSNLSSRSYSKSFTYVALCKFPDSNLDSKTKVGSVDDLGV
jgi:hypothetical protein